MSDHNQFLQRTIELARHSINSGGGPFAALIVYDGQIIAEGHNQVTALNDPTAHAEIMAIRLACRKRQDFQLQRCILYTSSEPCPMCLSAIYWSRLAAVYYANDCEQARTAGFDDDFIYQQLKRDHSSKSIPLYQSAAPQILAEAADIFRLWQQKEDKTDY